MSDPVRRNPIIGIAACCACAASGHVAAEPATTLMKSRRRIAFPRLRTTLLRLDYSRVLRSAEWGSRVGLHRLPMSALGQKQTFPNVRPMSALPPKADIRECGWLVR